jgi:deoxycytidylate deaminase
MAIILRDLELQEAAAWMNVAIEEAKKSPCARDKRGVVIVKDGLEIGLGFNAPPPGFICESRHCQPTCKDYAVHAEMNAIADAVRKGNGQKLIGARMYHARVEGGVLQDSRKPRCYQCSKHLVAFGLEEFVLKHEEGYALYSVQEFNRLSLESTKK